LRDGEQDNVHLSTLDGTTGIRELFDVGVPPACANELRSLL